MKNYDVVIVNYNGGEIIERCLLSIMASTLKPKKIIIYDNNSRDDSLKKIKAMKLKEVIVIAGKKNIGFGPGNNEALKEATSEFVLFMNNDLLLDKNCAKRLEMAFTSPKIAIINPLIIKGWDKKNEKNIYSFGANLNKAGFGYSLTDPEGQVERLTCFSGACFMARRKIIEKIGFEKNFFLYYEEPAISIELLKGGKKITRTAKAKCYHLENYSSPKKVSDGIAFRQFYGIQNRWYLLGKHWPLQLILYALTINMMHLLYFIIFFVRTWKLSYLKLACLAPFNFFKGLGSRAKKKTSRQKLV